MLLRTGAAGARRPAEETRRQLLGGEVEARDAALREVVEGVPEWGAAAAWIHQEDGDDLAGVAGEAAADANRLVLPRGGAAKDKPREQVRGGLAAAVARVVVVAAPGRRLDRDEEHDLGGQVDHAEAEAPAGPPRRGPREVVVRAHHDLAAPPAPAGT